MRFIRKLRLRHQNNRKISRALRRGFLLSVVSLALVAVPAYANPAPQGQEIYIYAGGGTTIKGDAYGSEHTDARVYYAGSWHGWVGCYRSTWNVHLWVCNYLYVPVGYWAYGQVAYENNNGWSYGYTPWDYSSCCEAHSATTGVLG